MPRDILDHFPQQISLGALFDKLRESEIGLFVVVVKVLVPVDGLATQPYPGNHDDGLNSTARGCVAPTVPELNRSEN
jgi:hypothetical protein